MPMVHQVFVLMKIKQRVQHQPHVTALVTHIACPLMAHGITSREPVSIQWPVTTAKMVHPMEILALRS